MNHPFTLLKRGYTLFTITKLELNKGQYFVEFDNGSVLSIFKPSQQFYSSNGNKISISNCKVGDKVYYALFKNWKRTNDKVMFSSKWKNVGDKLYSKLYHLTHVSKRKSIQEKGLIPFSKSTGIIRYSNRVFLTTHKNKIHEIMDFVGYDNVDLWEIDNRKLKIKLRADKFAKMKRCGYATQSIPPKFLKLERTFTF